MSTWNLETGEYTPPSSLWQPLETLIPEEAPEGWFSRPGGDYFLGISFHYAPYNYAKGEGILDGRFLYRNAPYLLKTSQDPYNSWGVNARLSNPSNIDTMSFWDWMPGILLLDTSTKYTLPAPALSAFAGTEWADNDNRIFCGLYSLDVYDTLTRKSLELINRLTGPSWPGWPFGDRQLADAVIVWMGQNDELPEVILLASVRQFGIKHSYLDRRLYNPQKLGGWEEKPKGWDCRKSVLFLYQAQLMISDGLSEIALSTAIAAIENASAEILAYLLGNDYIQAKKEMSNSRFLSRFDTLLPKHGAKLPTDLFQRLKQAYFTRNTVIHGLQAVQIEDAALHVNTRDYQDLWYTLALRGRSQRQCYAIQPKKRKRIGSWT